MKKETAIAEKIIAYDIYVKGPYDITIKMARAAIKKARGK